MKKRTLFDILIGICAILFLTNSSCDPEPENNGPTLSAQPASLTLEADGTGKTISVSSNTTWNVRSDDSWVKYSPTGGTGGSSITVSASINTGEERSTKLIISDKTGRATTEIRVTQKKGESSTPTPTPTPDPTLTVKPTSLNFTSTAGSNTITIESNTSWTVRSDQTWCTVSTSSGSNNATITVKVSENTSNQARDAFIIIDYNNTNANIAVSQEARYFETRSGTDIICTLYGVSFKMIGVERTSFDMGATTEQGDDAMDDESPWGEVVLESYYIGETEVTQELWQAVMGSNPSWFYGDQKPVESVNWNDCQEFITKLNEMTGQRFRLPTEAEWECAARGDHDYRGGYFKYAGSNNIEDVAWYPDNSNQETHNVAQKNPNEIGLYDMSGNVGEWCQDWYGNYDLSPHRGLLNPTGPSSGKYRVKRGGSWANDARACRVSARSWGLPEEKIYWIGLRLAR